MDGATPPALPVTLLSWSHQLGTLVLIFDVCIQGAAVIQLLMSQGGPPSA